MNNNAGVADETVEESNVSRQVYVDSGNEKKVLYLLCIGLTAPPNDDDDSSGTSDGSAKNKTFAMYRDFV
jgi:hypothetical protein